MSKILNETLPEGWVRLSDGKLLKSDYGKYGSNLLIIADRPVKFKEDDNRIDCSDLNLPCGSYRVIYGVFFMTRKGKFAFRVTTKELAEHMLLQDDWGGSFNRYRGGSLKKEDALYFHRASSNGGGTGYDYAVFPKNWRYNPSLDDF